MIRYLTKLRSGIRITFCNSDTSLETGDIGTLYMYSLHVCKDEEWEPSPPFYNVPRAKSGVFLCPAEALAK